MFSLNFLKKTPKKNNIEEGKELLNKNQEENLKNNEKEKLKQEITHSDSFEDAQELLEDAQKLLKEYNKKFEEVQKLLKENKEKFEVAQKLLKEYNYPEKIFELCKKISNLYKDFTEFDNKSEEFKCLDDGLADLYATAATQFLSIESKKKTNEELENNKKIEELSDKKDSLDNDTENDFFFVRQKENFDFMAQSLDSFEKDSSEKIITCAKFLMGKKEEDFDIIVQNLRSLVTSKKIKKSESLRYFFLEVRNYYLQKIKKLSAEEKDFFEKNKNMLPLELEKKKKNFNQDKEFWFLYADQFNQAYLGCTDFNQNEQLAERLKICDSVSSSGNVLKTQKAYILNVAEDWLVLSTTERAELKVKFPTACIEVVIENIKEKKKDINDKTDYDSQLTALYSEWIKEADISKDRERKSLYLSEINSFFENKNFDKETDNILLEKTEKLLFNALEMGPKQISKDLGKALYDSRIITNCLKLCKKNLKIDVLKKIAKFRNELITAYLTYTGYEKDLNKSQEFLNSAITACGDDDNTVAKVQLKWIEAEFKKEKTIERLTAITTLYNKLLKDSGQAKNSEGEYEKETREFFKNTLLPAQKKTLLDYLIETSNECKDFERERQLFNLAISIVSSEEKVSYIEKRISKFDNISYNNEGYKNYTEYGIMLLHGYYKLKFLLDYKDDYQKEIKACEKELFNDFLSLFKNISAFEKDLESYVSLFSSAKASVDPLNKWVTLLTQFDEKNRYYALKGYYLISGDHIQILKFIMDFLVKNAQNDEIKLSLLEFRRRLSVGFKENESSVKIYSELDKKEYIKESSFSNQQAIDKLVEPSEDIILAQIYLEFKKESDKEHCHYYPVFKLYKEIGFPNKDKYANNKALTKDMQNFNPDDLKKAYLDYINDVLRTIAKNPKFTGKGSSLQDVLRNSLSLLEECDFIAITTEKENRIISKEEFLKLSDKKNYALIEGTDFYAHKKLVKYDAKKLKEAILLRKGVKVTLHSEIQELITNSGGQILNEQEEMTLFLEEQKLIDEKNPIVIHFGDKYFIKYPGETKLSELDENAFENISFPKINEKSIIIKSNGNKEITEAIFFNKPDSFEIGSSFPELDGIKEVLLKIQKAFGPERSSSDARCRLALLLATDEQKCNIYDIQLTESNETDAINAIKGLANINDEKLKKTVDDYVKKHTKNNANIAFSMKKFGEAEKKAVNLYLQFSLSFSEKTEYKELGERLDFINKIVYEANKELSDEKSVALYLYFLDQLIAKLPINDKLKDKASEEKKFLLKTACKFLKNQKDKINLKVIDLIAPLLSEPDQIDLYLHSIPFAKGNEKNNLLKKVLPFLKDEQKNYKDNEWEEFLTIFFKAVLHFLKEKDKNSASLIVTELLLLDRVMKSKLFTDFCDKLKEKIKNSSSSEERERYEEIILLCYEKDPTKKRDYFFEMAEYYEGEEKNWELALEYYKKVFDSLSNSTEDNLFKNRVVIAQKEFLEKWADSVTQEYSQATNEFKKYCVWDFGQTFPSDDVFLKQTLGKKMSKFLPAADRFFEAMKKYELTKSNQAVSIADLAYWKVIKGLELPEEKYSLFLFNYLGPIWTEKGYDTYASLGANFGYKKKLKEKNPNEENSNLTTSHSNISLNPSNPFDSDNEENSNNLITNTGFEIFSNKDNNINKINKNDEGNNNNRSRRNSNSSTSS